MFSELGQVLAGMTGPGIGLNGLIGGMTGCGKIGCGITGCTGKIGSGMTGCGKIGCGITGWVGNMGCGMTGCGVSPAGGVGTPGKMLTLHAEMGSSASGIYNKRASLMIV